MPIPTPPPIFYQWASKVVDITRDYTASDEFLILLALDNLPQEDRGRLVELRVVFADLASGRYTDKQLLVLWQHTNARVYPRRSNEFFGAAVKVIDEYIRTNGKNARDMWDQLYGTG